MHTLLRLAKHPLVKKIVLTILIEMMRHATTRQPRR